MDLMELASEKWRRRIVLNMHRKMSCDFVVSDTISLFQVYYQIYEIKQVLD